ncbi:MAG: dual specificity protein phosphatase family protein [Nitrospirae bacterium]|nr:dual specificity protein phosphatase family protein [Nitrospirota bacterium]
MRRSNKIIVTILMLSVLVIGGYVAYIIEIGNFHPITPGESYRSAQLDGNQLEYYIKRNHIKSILNLRGGGSDMQWYRDEISMSAKYKVAHYDVTLSSSKEPSMDDVRRIIEIFNTAQRPILIHCKAGADRSGLVAAIWKVVVDKEPKSEAQKQLTIFYGHIPVAGTYAMDRFFYKWNP